MAVRDICTAVYANAEPPLPIPGAMVVFTDKRTGLVIGLSTDAEVERGRVLPHWFTDYDVHEGVSLTGPSPQVGQPWPRTA
jgi:hypothetical protein